MSPANVLKLDLNSTRWMPKLVSIDDQNHAALTLQSLRATIGPLQANCSNFVNYHRDLNIAIFVLQNI